MKIDRSRLRKSSSEVPPECQALIDRLCACSRDELLDELSKINTWTFGKCELYHWTTVLDIFDDILEEAATPEEDSKWALNCDIHYNQRVSYCKCFFEFAWVGNIGLEGCEVFHNHGGSTHELSFFCLFDNKQERWRKMGVGGFRLCSTRQLIDFTPTRLSQTKSHVEIVQINTLLTFNNR